MGAHLQFRKPNSDLSNIKEFELRMLNMEALMVEMRTELEDLRSRVSEEDLNRMEKMQRYQQAVDEMFGTLRAAAS